MTHYYDETVEFLESGTRGVVDLAKADQRALLAIMDHKSELYHWALFIFNGTECLASLQEKLLATRV